MDPNHPYVFEPVLWLLYGILSLKNDGSADLDPNNKMSRIHNTTCILKMSIKIACLDTTAVESWGWTTKSTLHLTAHSNYRPVFLIIFYVRSIVHLLNICHVYVGHWRKAIRKESQVKSSCSGLGHESFITQSQTDSCQSIRYRPQHHSREVCYEKGSAGQRAKTMSPGFLYHPSSIVLGNNWHNIFIFHIILWNFMGTIFRWNMFKKIWNTKHMWKVQMERYFLVALWRLQPLPGRGPGSPWPRCRTHAPAASATPSPGPYCSSVKIHKMV